MTIIIGAGLVAAAIVLDLGLVVTVIGIVAVVAAGIALVFATTGRGGTPQ
ncbi:hypothetical protein [Modestobacter sp. SYSU DS0511]